MKILKRGIQSLRLRQSLSYSLSNKRLINESRKKSTIMNFRSVPGNIARGLITDRAWCNDRGKYSRYRTRKQLLLYLLPGYVQNFPNPKTNEIVCILMRYEYERVKDKKTASLC